MKISVDIRPIKAIETHAVRHPVLRQGRPKSDCVFEGDERESSLHFGAFRRNALIGVCSAYQRQHHLLNGKKSFQVRGVAVLPIAQGHGIGKALMKTIEQKLIEIKCDVIWLNARENALFLYKRLNYLPLGEPFHIDKIGVHHCVYKILENA